jgi:hypothetical protein
MRTPVLAVAAVVATALAGPVSAAAQRDDDRGPAAGQRDDDRGPAPQFLEAEDLLPALESSTTPANPRTPGQAVARRATLDPLASGNAYVRFENESEGNRFTLRFPVEASDRYTVVVRPTRGPDHGVVRMAIDGRPVGDAVDLSAAELGRLDELTLGRLALAAGDHTLTVTVVRAGGGLDAGLDYLELRP